MSGGSFRGGLTINNKEDGKQKYMTFGKSYPKTNPKCTRYLMGGLVNKPEGCSVASQSQYLKNNLSIAYDGVFGGFYNNQNNYNVSTNPNDDKWPKNLGVTGKGRYGYNKCKEKCNNDPRCVAFESKNEFGKDKEFECILWGNTGTHAGAAIVPGNKYGKSPCWIKECQDNRHAFPQGSYTFVDFKNKLPNSRVQSSTSSASDYRGMPIYGLPHSSAQRKADLNYAYKTIPSGKTRTDVMLGDAEYATEIRNNSTYYINRDTKLNCGLTHWGDCSKDCDSGTRTRHKIWYEGNGGTCGPTSESCNTQPCSTTPSPVNCIQSAWGACSPSCGPGTQTRTTITPASNGGTACGPINRSCNNGPCPVNCVQSSWGSCSASCGPGTQTRTTITPASNGGTACGPTSRSCNNGPCEIKNYIMNNYLKNFSKVPLFLKKCFYFLHFLQLHDERFEP